MIDTQAIEFELRMKAQADHYRVMALQARQEALQGIMRMYIDMALGPLAAPWAALAWYLRRADQVNGGNDG
jgi:hypothetical protein